MGRTAARLVAAMLGLALECGVVPARAEPTCGAAVVLDCRLGLRTLVRARTYPFTESDGPMPKIARDEDEWSELWRFYGLAGRPPTVDHRGFVIFAIVAPFDCPPVGGCTMSLVGPTMPEPRIPTLDVWIFAYPRAAFRERCPDESIVDLSGLAGERAPRVEELERIDYDASCYSPEVVPAKQANDPFWHAVRFETSLRGMAGIDMSARPIFGALFGVGFARHTSDHDPWYDLGNEVGLELRARLLNVESNFVDSWSAGLRPWLALRRRWAFDFVNLKRKPSLVGVFVPEGGVFHRTGLGLRPYLAWSAPFAWHRREFFYRTSPYRLREHFAVHFEAGVLWVPREPVVATLALGVGLW